MGPISDGVALNITVMSYMGTMYFGLMACPEVVPDIWDLASAMNEALEELTKAAAPKPAKPAASAARPAAKRGPKPAKAEPRPAGAAR